MGAHHLSLNGLAQSGSKCSDVRHPSACRQTQLPPDPRPRRRVGSVEFEARRWLIRADAPRSDGGSGVIFAANGRARQTAQHADLSYMCERVGDGPLEKLFGRAAKRFGRSKTRVECFQRGEEALGTFIPREWRGVAPSLCATGFGERPLEEITKMGEDLSRGTAGIAHPKFGEGCGGSAKRFRTAIGESGEGVAEEFTASNAWRRFAW